MTLYHGRDDGSMDSIVFRVTFASAATIIGSLTREVLQKYTSWSRMGQRVPAETYGGRFAVAELVLSGKPEPLIALHGASSDFARPSTGRSVDLDLGKEIDDYLLMQMGLTDGRVVAYRCRRFRSKVSFEFLEADDTDPKLVTFMRFIADQVDERVSPGSRGYTARPVRIDARVADGSIASKLRVAAAQALGFPTTGRESASASPLGTGYSEGQRSRIDLDTFLRALVEGVALDDSALEKYGLDDMDVAKLTAENEGFAFVYERLQDLIRSGRHEEGCFPISDLQPPLGTLEEGERDAVTIAEAVDHLVGKGMAKYVYAVPDGFDGVPQGTYDSLTTIMRHAIGLSHEEKRRLLNVAVQKIQLIDRGARSNV